MSSAYSATPGNRSNVSLSHCDRACVSGGFTDWSAVLTVDPGLSSYSSLANTKPDTLLMLYEVGGGEKIAGLSLVAISLS